MNDALNAVVNYRQEKRAQDRATLYALLKKVDPSEQDVAALDAALTRLGLPIESAQRVAEMHSHVLRRERELAEAERDAKKVHAEYAKAKKALTDARDAYEAEHGRPPQVHRGVVNPNATSRKFQALEDAVASGEQALSRPAMISGLLDKARAELSQLEGETFRNGDIEGASIDDGHRSREPVPVQRTGDAQTTRRKRLADMTALDCLTNG